MIMIVIIRLQSGVSISIVSSISNTSVCVYVCTYVYIYIYNAITPGRARMRRHPCEAILSS